MSGQLTFEEWKKKKQANGEWLSPEDYQRKKDLERKEFLERELKKINQRLNPRSHEELQAEFVQYYQTESKKRKTEEPCSPKKKFITREIILDTETTGLGNSDRIVEISMLELVDGTKTGRKFHRFINPDTKISQKSIEIHKITNEKVKDCPKFEDLAEEIIKFIGNGTIIAHNASFDRRMLNCEMRRCGWEEYPEKRFIDTLEISRYLYPREKNNQDALCTRFGIDNHNRVSTGIHSAAEDTAHLYLIYKELESELRERSLTPYEFKLNHTVKVE